MDEHQHGGVIPFRRCVLLPREANRPLADEDFGNVGAFREGWRPGAPEPHRVRDEEQSRVER
ncbi:MAG: hypothetical protein ACYTDX_02690 [Planctomycetota bacterium]